MGPTLFVKKGFEGSGKTFNGWWLVSPSFEPDEGVDHVTIRKT